MKVLTAALAAIASALMFTACIHRPLEEMGNTHYIRVYIDDSIRNTTCRFYNDTLARPEFKLPQVVRVTLNDRQSGAQAAESYLQHSERDSLGYYLDGYIIADAGSYDLMVYNIGTETTNIRDNYNYNTATAYTNPIQSQLYARIPQSVRAFSGSKIAYMPDHLFVAAHRQVDIPYTHNIDTLRGHDGSFFKASTLVKAYYMQVRIKGIRYVSTATALLSGMAGSSVLATRSMVETDSVRLYMEMDNYRAADSVNTAYIYTTFNTFGKLPKENTLLTLTFEFITTDGRSQVETINITDLFATPMVRENQWIILDKEIIIDPPPTPPGPGGNSGGFTPKVDEWEDIRTDIPI